MRIIRTWLMPRLRAHQDIPAPAQASGVRAVVAAVGLPGAPGPTGPPGPPGASGQIITQATPAATWIIPHGLGRAPGVHVYLATGEQVDTDVTVTASVVTVTFPAAASGYLVLN